MSITVAELIEHLQMLPADWEVYADDDYNEIRLFDVADQSYTGRLNLDFNEFRPRPGYVLVVDYTDNPEGTPKGIRPHDEYPL